MWKSKLDILCLLYILDNLFLFFFLNKKINKKENIVSIHSLDASINNFFTLYVNGQPQVSCASANLTTETAIVWPVSEAKTAPNWQKQLGKTLAEHLTSCGFNSNLRGIFLRSST